MGVVEAPRKHIATNPLKMSQPLGGALAFLGLKGAMPLFHGSQGCTAFAKALLVKHFREAIPLQTTALTEVTTVLGGTENLHESLHHLIEKQKPSIIGLLSTGLTETKGEDMFGDLLAFQEQHPELRTTAVVPVSTPDFKGSLEDGFAAAVLAMIRDLVTEPLPARPGQVNLLAGSHLTAGDLDLIQDALSAYGLSAIILPDLGSSLDGHMGEGYSAVTIGGTPVERIPAMAASEATLVVGASLLPAAQILEERFGIPVHPFNRLTGLEPSDRFHHTLSQLSGQPVPEKVRSQRKRLQDAMLDAHFFFGGKEVAVALESDLLFAVTSFFREMGAGPLLAVAPTRTPLLEVIPADRLLIGDLWDLEREAKGADLLVTNSHGRHASERLRRPLLRRGIPVFDRLGTAYRTSVLYPGTMELLFEAGNLLMEAGH